MRSTNNATKLNWETKFSKQNKSGREKQRKDDKSLAQQGFPGRNGSYNFGKNTILKEKSKGIFEIAKLKKKRAVGKRYPGPNQ